MKKKKRKSVAEATKRRRLAAKKKLSIRRLREMPSRLYSEGRLTDEFHLFANQELIPLLKLTGYKLADKHHSARHILHSLIANGLAGHTTADSRNTNTNRLRIQVWDAILKSNMAIMAKGSEDSGLVSRYYPTPWLLEQRKLWELRLLCDIRLIRNTQHLDDPSRYGLVVLMSGDIDWLTGNPISNQPISIRDRIEATCERDKKDVRKPDPQALANGLAYFRKLEDRIESINQNNLKHSWVAYREIEGVDGEPRTIAFHPNICLRQLHSGDMFRCVRLYSWGGISCQGMPKDQRSTIEIDGEQTVELDYSGYHTRILYHLKKIDVEGDVYRPDVIFPIFYSWTNASNDKKNQLRNIIKKAVNIMWNTKSKPQAIAALRNELKQFPPDIQSIFYKVENSGAGDLFHRIENALWQLSNCFYNQAAVNLMTADGNVMKHILLGFVEADKPAFGVHDSLIVKASDSMFAMEMMQRIYQKFFNFKPLIHQF